MISEIAPMSIFSNCALLTDVHDHDVQTMMGTFKDYGGVCFNPDYGVNIISLCKAKANPQVEVKYAQGIYALRNIKSNRLIKFTLLNGVYAYDTRQEHVFTQPLRSTVPLSLIHI